MVVVVVVVCLFVGGGRGGRDSAAGVRHEHGPCYVVTVLQMGGSWWCVHMTQVRGLVAWCCRHQHNVYAWCIGAIDGACPVALPMVVWPHSFFWAVVMAALLLLTAPGPAVAYVCMMQVL